MNDVCGALILLAFVACAYFLVRLIISFIKKGEKKYYAKRLAAAFAVVIAASIGFSMTQTPEQKAAYQAKREAQQKEAEEKKAAEEKAAADKKAADEKALAEKKKADAEKKEKELTEKKALEEQKATEAKAKVDATPKQVNATSNDAGNRVKNKVREYIKDYYGTNIDSVTVNPDLGTEKDGDYVALVRLTWTVNNRGETSKKMLDMYSSDMAAKMYTDLPEVQELAVFWTVPYLNNGSAKISFERTNGGMRYTDKIFDRNFNQ